MTTTNTLWFLMCGGCFRSGAALTALAEFPH